ncbi:hypothetical protein ACFPYI_21115 [Halomarina salina]|uniref:Dolichyl-phosphate-mannose-protein mannosyltransferase n=1 Tax=Halomarina salina TaxID=1872699 RepID=A0ABD5RTR8_9EURY|nr:hypothetical protein [Halomarina salina]
MKYEDSARRRRSKLLLIVGFLGLALAIVRAHFAPATGYELSIYGATPVEVWIGVAIALLVAVAVTALRPRGWLVPTSLGLAILATATVVFMPTIRGYYAYGRADELTHMGWARGIISGEMGAMDIFYPGGHTSVGLIHAVTGISIPHSMMLLVQLLALVFLVFLPLTVRTLVDDRAGTAIATFAACMFLPITNISTYLTFHPYTMTTLFFPVILFLLFEYLSRRSRGLANGVTATGLLLFVGAVGSILYHGQVALNILILFATIALAQKFYQWLPGGSTFADARSLAVPTVLFGAFYVVWASRYQIVYSMFDMVSTSVQKWVEGEAGAGGGSVASTGDSASKVGISIIELFMKLFFVKTVFVALAAILVLVALAGRLDDGPEDRNEAITYFAYGGLVLGPFFLAHFLGDVSKYFFRHVGFAMVIATILGVVMLHSFYRAIAGGKYDGALRAVAAIAIVGGLLLSLIVVFPSPYIYLPSTGTTEAVHDGYNTSFAYNANDTRWNDIRSGPGRFQDAQRTSGVVPWGTVTEKNLIADNLTSHSPYPYYLSISAFNYQREVDAYRGATFSKEALDSISDEDGVSRVLSTGVRSDDGTRLDNGLVVYYVDSSYPPDRGSDDDASANDSGGEGQQTEGPSTQQTQSQPTETRTPIPEVTQAPPSTSTPAAGNGTATGGGTTAGGGGSTDAGGGGTGGAQTTTGTTGGGGGTGDGGDGGSTETGGATTTAPSGGTTTAPSTPTGTTTGTDGGNTTGSFLPFGGLLGGI